jgi:hypothetical protein
MYILEIVDGEVTVSDPLIADIDEAIAHHLSTRDYEAVRVPTPRGEGEIIGYAPSHMERREPNCWVEGWPVHVFGPLVLVGIEPDGSHRWLTPAEAGSYELVPDDRTSDPCLILSPAPTDAN